MNYMEYNCLYIFSPTNKEYHIHHIDNENDYCYKSINLLSEVKTNDIVVFFNHTEKFLNLRYKEYSENFTKIYNITQNITSHINTKHLNFFRKL